jgi:hypothetical protein
MVVPLERGLLCSEAPKMKAKRLKRDMKKEYYMQKRKRCQSTSALAFYTIVFFFFLQGKERKPFLGKTKSAGTETRRALTRTHQQHARSTASR